MYSDPAIEFGSQHGGAVYTESATSLTGAKRSRPGDDEDEFETDSRVPNNRRRVDDGPRAKRARFDGPASYNARQLSAAAVSGTSSSQIPDGGQSIKDPPSSYMDPDLAALSQKSREVSLAARKPKGPQTRTPWSRLDCKLLIRAVDTYKCRWSTIEKEVQNGTIPFEYPRDQQALRDKARLLKQDFLK